MNDYKNCNLYAGTNRLSTLASVLKAFSGFLYYILLQKLFLY